MSPSAEDFNLSPDTFNIALAMALLWTWRPLTDFPKMLRLLKLKRSDGQAYAHEDIRRAFQVLKERGLLVANDSQNIYVRLHDTLRVPMYRVLLSRYSGFLLRQTVFDFVGYPAQNSRYSWSFNDVNTMAILRVALLTGLSANEFITIKFNIQKGLGRWASLIREAIFTPFDRVSFERIEPELAWDLLVSAVNWMNLSWGVDFAAACDLAEARFDADAAALPFQLQLELAELFLHRGDVPRLERALEGISNAQAQALRAALLYQQGQYLPAQLAFEAAMKERQSEIGGRKHLFSESVIWRYPLAILAQTPQPRLDLARKFCLNESGSREPIRFNAWGAWVHAIGVRLGEAQVDVDAFVYSQGNNKPLPDWHNFWRLMLAAWLGPVGLGLDDQRLKKFEELAQDLHSHLLLCRLDWLAVQVESALTVLRGNQPPAGFFVTGIGEQWREVLSALQALPGDDATAVQRAESARILWQLSLDKDGALLKIETLEQRRGVRGWVKPKPLSLAKLVSKEHLPPWDAKVMRAIRQENALYSIRHFVDTAAAIIELIGHPAVVLEGAPDRLIELVAGMPTLEVVREGDIFRMRVFPTLRPEIKRVRAYNENPERIREEEALRMITLVQESPQRYQVIQLNTAQCRAAQLVSGRFAMPASAQDELKQSLDVLARHFQVHSDSAQVAREIAPETRLHAELSPAGDDLVLRLVATPLGGEGPRLPPGSGRNRVISVIDNETVGTQRDFNAERISIDSVLDALPFLEHPEIQGGCEWQVSDPEQALAMVEILPSLPAIAAVEWPKGKAVRVVRINSAKMALNVSSERDWFRVAGEAKLDDGLVLAFTALLEASRQKSRFIPMGDGVYAALTQRLKDRLADLAAVIEMDKHGARIPQIAASWLDDALHGMEVKKDKAFRAAIDRLRAAQSETPKLPSSLQAELRPYQEDGYQWAMRLASAGLGGCLADDMGLGKTLQALAVMLARGGKGPALVIAPTSVCGNWLAETRRFAPSLNPQIYGEGDRETLVTEAGPMDVVIVSYTLVLQAKERFAGRVWHTLIADEAQAIKNASAKRSKAVFDLDAGFRLALSGTPVENRLAELWSIMRYVNPGLLGSLSRFNERFAIPIERNRSREAQHMLRRLIAPFVLRRTKSEVLQELPPRTELNLLIEADVHEAAHYEALRRQALAEAGEALAGDAPGDARLNILAQLTRLRRAACDPRLTSPEIKLQGAKVQAFAELAAELVANGHKALVFSQFVDFLSLLRAPLDAASIAYQYLDGSTPAAERTKRVAAFQAGEGDLFLISLKAGGFGLNLTAADYVVITDPWWNPAAEDQAMGRAHRMGQLRPVTVYRLVGKGTIEERIVDLHHDKRALAEGVLSGSGEESTALPSTEDLIALMRG